MGSLNFFGKLAPFAVRLGSTVVDTDIRKAWIVVELIAINVPGAAANPPSFVCTMENTVKS